MKQNVIIIIPALNEEKTIVPTIAKIKKIFLGKKKPSDYKISILAIDDGSTDSTLDLLKETKVEVISHPKNLGLGAACRTGMQRAYEMGADVAIKIDADMQNDIEDIDSVLRPLLEKKADICFGYRNLTYKMPLIRRWGNRFFSWMMNRFTDYNITDAQTSVYACNRRYLSMFEIYGNYNVNQQLLLDAHFKHMVYTEVPIKFHERKEGKSFISLKYPFKVIPNILRVIIYANPIVIFGTLGFLMLLASCSIVLFWVLNEKLSLNMSAYIPPNNTALMLFIGGLQTFFFGILADLILKKRSK